METNTVDDQNPNFQVPKSERKEFGIQAAFWAFNQTQVIQTIFLYKFQFGSAI